MYGQRWQHASSLSYRIATGGRSWNSPCYICLRAAHAALQGTMLSKKGRLARELISASYSLWNQHNAPRLGAALAYYALLSMAPLSILVVAICGFVFGKSEAEQDVLRQTASLIGPGGAATLRTLIENARQPGTGIFATVVALATLLFGASGVFIELRNELNTVWGVPEGYSGGFRGMVWQRIVAFGMIIGLGVLLVLSLIVSAALAFIEKFTTGVVPIPAAITGEILNLFFSLLAISILFALVFKFVPQTPIPWRDVGIGGIVTGILFMIGRSLLALYLSTSAVGSAYGAAGSLVALVVWVYYSAQIFFFGAVFTRVYADRLGSRSIHPKRQPA
jgi:membrane protein